MQREEGARLGIHGGIFRGRGEAGAGEAVNRDAILCPDTNFVDKDGVVLAGLILHG